jgi:hypothetical protein
MKESGIIFSGPMVRALLEGSKTQTRRIVKNRKHPDFGCDIAPGELAREQQHVIERSCPYGQPGDRLWVKEAWGVLYPQYINDADELTFWKADYSNQELEEQILPKWKSPLFMPRSRSRILLEITSVRVERLQDISEEDARAEGVTLPERTCTMYDGMWRDGYRVLWESINGDGSWDANPWVWVISFKQIKP